MDGELWTFEIPASLDDLTADMPEEMENAAAYDKLYHVQQVYSPNQLESLLLKAQENLRNNSAKFILADFDIFFSVLKHYSSLSQPVRDKAWSLLLKSLIRFQPELVEYFEHFNIALRNEVLNTLLMLMYLFLTISDSFEANETADSIGDLSEDNFGGGGGRGKKKKKAPGSKSKEYQNNKAQAIKVLSKIFMLALERLFESPAQLTELVNLITKYTYKVLENSAGNKAAFNNYSTDTYLIIGTALDKYDHSATYCMRLIELLQGKESMIQVVSSLVVNHLQNNHCIHIMDIIQQIKALDLNTLSRDNSASKAVGCFLVEIAKHCPEKMYQNLLSLVEFLSQEPYTLRNAVLEIIACIILTMFHLPTKNREIEIKRKLLAFLYDHIHDANSYTRSKVLQLWAKLVEAGAIPMSKLNEITGCIIGRLDDKACFVRKNAVHFLMQAIKDNPFTLVRGRELEQFKLIYRAAYEKNSAELEAIKNRQLTRMEEVMKLTGDDDDDNKTDDETDEEDDEDEEIDETSSNRRRKRSPKKEKASESEEVLSPLKRQKLMSKIATQWDSLEDALLEFWAKTGKNINFQSSTLEDEQLQKLLESSVEEALTAFRSLLKERKFEPALTLLAATKTLYPNEPVFQVGNGEEIDDGEVLNDDAEDQSMMDVDDHLFLSAITNFAIDFSNKLPHYIGLARRVFLAPLIDFGNAPVEASEESGNNKKNDCLSKFLAEHGDGMASDSANIERLEGFLLQAHQVLRHIKEAQTFLDALSEAVPKICQLLQSKNVPDVLEAITFFKCAFKLQLDKAIVGMQQMLKLIFSNEKTIKEKLVEAFKEIYLNEADDRFRGSVEEDENLDPEENEENGEQPTTAKRIALREVRNLSKLILTLNQGEMLCAEALIKQLYLEGKTFKPIHLQVLWERYAMKLSGTGSEESRAALVLIGMLASAAPSLVHNETNLETLVRVSLEEPRCSDYRLVGDTCDVLIRAFTLPSVEAGERFLKLPNDHALFVRLKDILVGSFVVEPNPTEESKYWNQMAAHSVKVIYFYAQFPDYLISAVLVESYKKMISFQSSASSSQESSCTPTSLQVDNLLISRFISLLGHVAVFVLIHLDQHLMREIKIRQHLADKSKEKQLMSKRTRKNAKGKGKSKRSLEMTAMGDDDDEGDEIIGPHSNEDPIQMHVTRMCDEGILYGNGILGKFKPLVEAIASDYSGQKYSKVVRIAASLTLSKFMVLSLKYTREKRDILAHLLELSPDWEVRSNAVISFGDLLVRYPNEFEHYAGKIFARLGDPLFAVQVNTLKVLTRLILADMIKPKGHISLIARLVTDSNDVIRDTARLFFLELAKKNNASVYNFLTDIISNLSGRGGMPEEDFHEMIRFLFDLLEKARNTETLVVKLCQRFNGQSDERQHRDLSFCLGQLPLTDRSIVSLHTHLDSYIHAIAHDTVYDNMKAIFAKFRATKGVMVDDTKLLLDELESKMKVQREKGIGGKKADEDAKEADAAGDDSDFEQAVPARSMAPPAGPTGRRGRPGKKAVTEEVAPRFRRGGAAQTKKAPTREVMPSTRTTRLRSSTAVDGTRPALSRAARRRRVIDSESSDEGDTYDFDE